MSKNLTLKEWVIDLFEDERGNTSIKPVIAFIGSLFLCVTMFINGISHHDFIPSDSLVNAVMVITAIGMGADSIDKFSFIGKNKETPNDNNKTSGDKYQENPDV